MKLSRNEKLNIDKREFIEEIIKKDADWVKSRRVEYLNNKKSKIYKDIAEWLPVLAKWNLIQYADINNEVKEIKKINKEIHIYEHPKRIEGLTDEMIENARNYPITDLIDVDKRGFAICPFHDDKHPSAFCKKNYLYCFSCNAQADTIKLYMHLHNCDFKTAVKSLN